MDTCAILSPSFIVTPTEHLLPHSGKKKKIHASQQALEMYENVKAEGNLLVPVWIDMLADAQDFVCQKYLEKLNHLLNNKPPAGLMIYGLTHT